MYLGTKEILTTSEKENMVTVIYKDGGEEQFSKEQFENIKTEESLDESSFRLKRCLFIEQKLYDVLLEHNLYLGDIENICQRLPHSVSHNFNEASNKLWGKSEGKTLWDVHKIIDNI